MVLSLKCDKDMPCNNGKIDLPFAKGVTVRKVAKCNLRRDSCLVFLIMPFGLALQFPILSDNSQYSHGCPKLHEINRITHKDITSNSKPMVVGAAHPFIPVTYMFCDDLRVLSVSSL